MDQQNQSLSPLSDEMIIAWLEGEMTAEEAEFFEQLIASDPALERRVQQTRRGLATVRAWFADDPPGADRAASLPIPPLAKPEPSALAAPRLAAAVWRWRFALARGLAAAAIFIVGFLAGHIDSRQVVILQPVKKSPAPSPVASAPSTAPADHPSQISNFKFQISNPQSPAPSPAPNLKSQISNLKSPSPSTAAPTTPQSQVSPFTIHHSPLNPPAPASALRASSPPPMSARDENGRVIIETTLTGSDARAVWVVDGSFQVASSKMESKGTVQ